MSRRKKWTTRTPPTLAERNGEEGRLIGTEPLATWNNMLGLAVQRFALNAGPDESNTIQGQIGLYCQMCAVRTIRNPNCNVVPGWTPIRALRGVTSTSNKEVALLRIPSSAEGLVPSRLRTYHKDTLPLLFASALEI
jgi:hypothetical protein